MWNVPMFHIPGVSFPCKGPWLLGVLSCVHPLPGVRQLWESLLSVPILRCAGPRALGADPWLGKSSGTEAPRPINH